MRRLLLATALTLAIVMPADSIEFRSASGAQLGSPGFDRPGGETFYLRASGSGAAPKTRAGAFSASGVNNASNWAATANSADGKIGPGDTIIVLDDDGPIRTQIYPAGNGLAGRHVTYQGESGGAAKFSGFDVITGWTDYVPAIPWVSTFNDGFESGDAALWGIQTSTPVFHLTGARTGSFGMYANNDNMSIGEDDVNANSKRIIFYFKCISETMADGGRVGISEIRPISGGASATVAWFHQAGGLLYVDLDDVNGVGLENSFAISAGTFYKLEYIVSRGTDEAYLYVNDVLVDTEAVIDDTWASMYLESNRGTPTTSVLAFDDSELYSGPSTGNVWRAALATEPKAFVLFDGVPGTEVASCPGDVNSAGEWCWASNFLYVYSTVDPDTITLEASQRNYTFINDSDFITVRNLILEGANNGFGGIVTGEYEEEAPINNTFDDIEVRYNRAAGVHWGEFAGGGYRLTNSLIHHNETHGVNPNRHLCTSGNPCLMANNEIYNNGAYGIFLYSSHTTVEFNNVHNNGSASLAGSGISPYSDPEDGDWGDDNIVRWNTVRDQISAGSDGYGIAVDHYADDNQIYGNVVYGCDVGIGIYAALGTIVYNNTVYGNSVAPGGNYGELSISDDPYDRVSGTIVRNNVFMATQSTVAVQLRDAPYASTTINNNIYYKASGDWWEYNTAATGATMAGWRTASGVDAASLNANPLLVSPTTDFRLQAGSPALNVGASVGLTGDIVGTAIPQGAGPDLGAYERP